MIGYGYQAVTTGISVRKVVGGIPIIGGFMSRLFKKPSSPDGYKKFCNPDPRTGGYYPGEEKIPFLKAFLNRQPMTAKMKADCTKFVLMRSTNWTKACKANLRSHCANIQVIPDPPPPKPVEVHTLSASYNKESLEKGIQKSRDVHEVIQAGISKIPIYVLVGIGALFILPQLLRTRGGRE